MCVDIKLALGIHFTAVNGLKPLRVEKETNKFQISKNYWQDCCQFHNLAFENSAGHWSQGEKKIKQHNNY